MRPISTLMYLNCRPRWALYFVSFLLSAFALSGPGYAATAGGAIQGTLYDPSGNAVTSSSVNFKVQVLDKYGVCVLYEEIHPALDLSQTNGDFSFDLGYGTSSSNNVTGGTALDENVFRNDVNINSSVTCPAGVAVSSGDARLVHVQFDVGSGYTALTPDMRVQGGAYASVAQTIQGRTPASFIQVVDDGTTALNQSNTSNIFSVANYAKLLALLAGTSPSYQSTTPTSAINENGQRIANVGAPTTSTDAATRGYADSNVGGKSVDVSAVGTAAGNGDTLVWSAAQNKWVATSLAISGTAGGDLTGSYPSPTIAANAITSAKINNSGGGINRLLITDTMTGATVGYAVCALNQVMAWTASGWACANPATLAPVTSVAGKSGAVTLNAADINGLGSAALLNYGTAAGQVVALNGTAQLPALDGSLLTGVNATKLQGRTVASTGPSNGQLLGWNSVATQWEPTSVNASLTYPLLANPTGTPTAPAYSFNGNASTGMYSPGVGTAAFATNGNARLTIDGVGNVGIGTTAPVSALDIEGTFTGTAKNMLTLVNNDASSTALTSITMTSGTSSGYLQTYYSGSTSTPASKSGGTYLVSPDHVGLHGVNYLDLITGFTSRMRIDATGNVGIGTSTPATIFDVYATGAQSAMLVPRDTAANRPSGVNGMIRYNTSGNAIEAFTNGSWQSLAAGSGVGTVQSIVTSTGLLGGTITSNGTISVNAGTAALQIVRQNASAQIAQSSGSSSLPAYAFAGDTASGLYSAGVGTTAFATNGTARLTINGAGNVGIGTITPAAALDIVAINGSAAGALIRAAASQSANLVQFNNSAGSVLSGITPSGRFAAPAGLVAAPGLTFLNDQFSGLYSPATGSLGFVSNGIDAIRVNSSGYIGVGTLSPAAVLDVFGTGAQGAMLVPRDTLANRPTGVNGMIRYNTSGNAIEAFTNGSWQSLAAGSGVGTVQNIITSTGLLGGTITSNGTISVNAGTAVLQIVQENASAQIAQSSGSALSPAFTFATNNSTGLYSPGAGTAAFATNGTSRLTIDSIGNLGVGTSSPSAQLQVANDIIAGTKISIGSSQYADLNLTNNGTIYQNGGDPFSRLQSTGSGNARIELQSNGPSGGATNAGHEAGRVDFGGYTGASWINQTASLKGIAESSWTGLSTPMALTFSTTANTTISEQMRITGNGNVGIGTQAPATLLDVYGTGTQSALLVPRDTAANRPTGVNGMIRYNTSGNAIEAFTNGSWQSLAAGSGVGTVQSVVTSTGLLGGTITANGTISVNAGTAPQQIVQENSNAQITQSNGNAGAPAYSFSGDQTTGIYDPGTGSLGLATAGTSRLLIDNFGNVSVGPASSIPLGVTSTFDIQTTGMNTPGLGVTWAGIGANVTSALSGTTAIGNLNGILGSLDIPSTATSGAATSTGVMGLLSDESGINAPTSGTQGGFFLNLISGTNRRLSGAHGSYSRTVAYGPGLVATTLDGSYAQGRIFSGTANYLYGAVGLSSLDGGSVGTAAALFAYSTISATTVTEQDGLLVKMNSTGGASQNRYGIHVTSANSTAPTVADYGIVVDSSTAINSFAGYTGIGTISPVAPLEVASYSTSGTPSTTSDVGQLVNVTSNFTTVQMGIGTLSTGPNSFWFQTKQNNNSGGTFPIVLNPLGGFVGIGTLAPAAELDVYGTGARSAMLVPRDTAANRPAGVNGMIRYNTSGNVIEAFTNGSWQSLAAGSGVGTVQSIVTSTGLLGGTITSNGTISVNVGSGSLQIPQLNGSAQLALSAGTQSAPAHTFTTDLTSGLFLPGIGTAALSTGGLQRLTVDANGFVGIATAKPLAPLHVSLGGTVASSFTPSNGDALIVSKTVGAGDTASLYLLGGSGASGNAILYLGNSDNPQRAAVSTSAGTDLRLSANNAIRMYIGSSGNIGINSTTPASILDVNGTGSTSAMIAPRDTQANRPTGVNGMLRYNTTNSAFEFFQNNAWVTYNTGSAGALSFPLLASPQTAAPGAPSYSFSGNTNTGLFSPATNQVAISTSGTTAMTINASGNIGFGTATPSSAFEVYDPGVHYPATSSVKGRVSLGQVTSGSYGGNGITFSEPLAGSGTGSFTISKLNDYTSFAILGQSGTGIAPLVIDPTGRFAFSNTSYIYPQNLADFKGSMAIGSFAGVNSAPPNGLIVSGNVGIGTSTPGSTLDVYGTGAQSAMLVPRDTATNRPTGINGMLRYNTSANSFEFFQNNAWVSYNTGSAGALNFPLLASPGVSTAGAPSYSFSGNANTGFYSPGAGTTAFSNNGATSLTIDGSGHVGVGITAPGASLDVSGVLTSNAGTASALNILETSSSGYSVNTINAAQFTLNSASTNATTVNGVVGVVNNNSVGATINGGNFSVLNTVNTPTTTNGLLAVATNQGGNANTINGGSFTASQAINGYTVNTLTGVSAISANASTSTITNSRGIYTTVTNSGTVTNGYGLYVDSVAGTKRYGIYENSGGTNYFQGAIGLGTTAPAALLDAYGTGNLSAILLPRDTTTNRPTGINGMVRYNTSANTFEFFQNNAWVTYNTGSAGALSFPLLASPQTAAPGAPSYSFSGNTNTGLFSPATNQVAIATAGTTALIVNSSGYLGLGTNNPASTLDVNGAIDVKGLNAFSLPSDFTPNASLAIGPGALTAQTTGVVIQGNTAVGAQALGNASLTTNALKNTAIGYQAGNNTKTGTSNTYVGFQAMAGTSGNESNTTVIGAGATAQTGAGGGSATIIGANATCCAGGSGGVVIGVYASGSNNGGVSISGTQAGNGAISIGSSSVTANTYGIALGTNAKNLGVSGISIGAGAGNSGLTGSNDLLIGSGVGSTTLTTGTSNILIGTSNLVDTPSASTNNFLNIANLIYGVNIGTSASGSVGVGTAAPAVLLDVFGTGAQSAMLVPRDTAANRPTGVNGMLRYNTSANAFEFFQNNAWVSYNTGSAGALSFPLLASPQTAAPGAPSYSFSGNTNTGLFSPATNQVAIAANGTTVLKIVAGGNVGINSSSPAYPLDVGGNVNIGPGSQLLLAGLNGLAVPTSDTIVVGNSATATNLSSPGYNTVVGQQAMNNGASTARYGTAIGYQALNQNSAWTNSAVGALSLGINTTGGDNVGLGYSAGGGNISGSENTFLGAKAGRASQTTSYNTAIGANSLYTASGGSNTVVGEEAGFNVTSGSFNTIVGQLGGSNLTSGSNNIVIGQNSLVPIGTGSNQVVIGSLLYGNQTSGTLGINSINPQAALDVYGTGAQSAMLVPRDTAANRPTGINGMLRYNTSANSFEFFQANAWVSYNTSAASGTVTSITSGTGLVSGTITSAGTIHINAGTGASQIVQENASAQILQSAGSVSLPSYAFANSTSTGLFSPSAGLATLATNGTARLTINGAGNIGIGTTAPVRKMEIAQNNVPATSVDNTVMIRLLNSDTTGTILNSSQAGIGFGSTTTRQAIVAGTYGNDYIDFYTSAILTTPKIRIDANGNLGIGTTAPAAALDVYGTGVLSAIVAPRDSTASRPTGTNGMFRFNTDTSAFEFFQANAWVSYNTGSGNGTVTNVTAGTGLVGGTITTNGTISVNVGTSPLQIVGQNANAQIGQSAGSAILPAYSFANDANTGFYSIAPGTAAFATNGTARLTFDGAGNVGIGSSAPTQALDVAGSVKAMSFISPSDRRLKTDIRPIEGLERILKLRGVRYTWIANHHPDIGVIAQELEAVYPELVTTDPVSDLKAVKYQGLIAPLIESTKEIYGLCKDTQDQVKDQGREVASLKAEVSELKNKNQALEQRLEAIERALKIAK